MKIRKYIGNSETPTLVDIPADHARILTLLQRLHAECGGKMLNKDAVTEYGLNEYFPSHSGKYEVEFMYGSPRYLLVPEGQYTVLGGNIMCRAEKFWKRFCESFEVEVLSEGDCPRGKSNYEGLVAVKEKWRW